jgi:hypothetical protein
LRQPELFIFYFDSTWFFFLCYHLSWRSKTAGYYRKHGRCRKCLNKSENNSKAEEAKGAAKILMIIVLPMFLILVGYLMVKKKI